MAKDSALEYAIRRSLEEVKNYENCANLLEQSADLINELEARGYHVGISIPSGNISLNIPTPAFTFADAPELFNLLSFIQDHISAEPGMYDLPEYSNRVFVFDDTKGKTGIHIVVYAVLAENGTCVRVVTGAKKSQKMVYVDVEEPTYEFKCV